MADLYFDGENEEMADGLDGDFSLIPSGDYPAVMVGSEMKDTNDKTGKYLETQFSIFGDKYQNRRVWHSFTRKNNNPVAVQIGSKQLDDVCIALGIPSKVAQSQEFHNKPLMITVAIEKGKAKKGQPGEFWPDKNVIKAFKAMPGSRPRSTVQSPDTTTASQPSMGQEMAEANQMSQEQAEKDQNQKRDQDPWL